MSANPPPPPKALSYKELVAQSKELGLPTYTRKSFKDPTTGKLIQKRFYYNSSELAFNIDQAKLEGSGGEEEENGKELITIPLQKLKDQVERDMEDEKQRYLLKLMSASH